MTGSPAQNASARRCIISDEVLTADNDSRAHVIPSALGGRLKPLGVLSRSANTLLGDTVDQLLVDALHPLMAQLDGSRDRGSNPPIEMEDADGRRYRVDFGETIQLARPDYCVTEEPDRTVISIQARTMKEARTLLGRVKSRVPDFDIDEAIKHAKVVRSWPPGDGMLRSQLEIGPRRTFPALFVAASVFAASRGLACHHSLRAYVETFDIENPTLPPDTFNFYSTEPWATAPGEVTHKVVFLGDPVRGLALVFFELFNILEIAVTLPFNGSEQRIETYGVDVLTGAEVQVDVNAAAILSRRWEATHDLEPRLYEIIEKRVGRILKIAQRRGADVTVQRDIDEFQARLADGGILTGASLLRALEVPANFLEMELQRPNMPPEQARQIAAEFAAMVGTMGALLPTSRRGDFDTGADALVLRIARAAGIPE